MLSSAGKRNVSKIMTSISPARQSQFRGTVCAEDREHVNEILNTNVDSASNFDLIGTFFRVGGSEAISSCD